VEGPAGDCIVKQSLPYLRAVGEGLPMPLSRIRYEHQTAAEHARHVPHLVPEIYHFDPVLHCIVMERLSPHVILRRRMIEGVRYPKVADAVAEYMARTLFFTSALALTGEELRARAAAASGNRGLMALCEGIMFTEPYMLHPRNGWTSPQLDAIAAEMRADVALKRAACELKIRYMTASEALIHADVHTGHFMVTEEDTRLIDPEFSFYGPMGYDTGMCVGNFLMNYFAQDGLAPLGESRADYQDWVLETMEAIWTGFVRRFSVLWETDRTGDAYAAALFEGAGDGAAVAAIRRDFLDRLWRDTLGFAAVEMIRRIISIAHNLDLEIIADPDVRAACETRCLRLARDLMVNAGTYSGIAAVADAARQVRSA
jgi:5-methylthioribose kinase